MLLATDQFQPWCDHLLQTPGSDAKVVHSYCDRLFRLLWKAASSSSDALSFRSTALACMMRCPTYTPAYLVQQVGFRVDRFGWTLLRSAYGLPFADVESRSAIRADVHALQGRVRPLGRLLSQLGAGFAHS